MKKIILSLVIAGAALSAFAQADKDAKITLSSRGGDVKFAFATLFDQAHVPYVIAPNVRATVYVSLMNEPFEKALSILTETSGVKVELSEGVYHVFMIRGAANPAQTKSEPKSETKPLETKPIEIKPVATKHGAPKIEPTTAAEVKVLPLSVLEKRVTSRVSKTDIRKVFADLGKQAQVTIEIDSSVPGYKIDAYLLNTSLKYALAKITDAAGLEYRFTQNNSIKVSKPSARVALKD